MCEWDHNYVLLVFAAKKEKISNAKSVPVFIGSPAAWYTQTYKPSNVSDTKQVFDTEDWK